MASEIAKWVLPTPGGPRKTTFSPLDEAEFVRGVDLLPVDRGLEAEVEVGQRLHGGQSAGAHGGGEAAAVAQGDLGGEELLDRLGGRRPAALHAG